MVSGYRKVLGELKRCLPVRFSDPALHSKLPSEGGVYLVSRLRRGFAEIMYVGKAKSLKGRLYQNLLNGQLRSHTLSRKCAALYCLDDKPHVKAFLQKNCAVQWVRVPDGKERSFVEHFLIAYFRSPLND